MEFAISQPKMVRLLWNEKQTRPLNPRPQMWPSGLNLAMTLTLNFQGQIWNLLYLSQKWSYCHKMKSKYIDSTLGLKCDHQFWLCPWPWLEFSRVDKKFAISQPKVVQLPQNEKQIYRLNSRPQMWPMGLTITMTWSLTWSLNFQGQVWPCPLTTHMTLTMEIHGQILK